MAFGDVDRELVAEHVVGIQHVGELEVMARECVDVELTLGDGTSSHASLPGTRASIRARRTSRVRAAVLLLAVVLLLQAPARAIRCSQWTRQSYEQKIDLIDQMTEDALGSPQCGSPGSIGSRFRAASRTTPR